MLSVRLQAVADMVTPNNVIADIGTDHGYVPIYLVKNKISPYAYAMDINEGPIMRAANNIEEEGLTDKIEAIQSDGMEKLISGMADTVVIAGMGGELIINILKNSKVNDALKELILSPHKNADMVRSHIMSMGWHIEDENMVFDMGKFYNIIKAVPGEEKDTYNEIETLYGRSLLNKKSKVLREYLEKEYEKFLSIMQTMKEHDSKNIDEIERILEYNREAVRVYD